MTPDELLRTPDGKHYELLDGVPKAKPNGAEAGRVGGVLVWALLGQVRPRKLGHVYGATAGYRCFPGRPDHVRVPDGSFVAAGRLPGDQSPPGYIEIPPDLTFEIVSPEERAEELEEKIADFRSVGVRLIWVVHPAARRVQVYRADGTVAELGEAGTLSGEDVLPGFTCPVAELFA